MVQPKKSPRFATDATFASGPEAGQPTKIEPSSGMVAKGFRPRRRSGPERFNWLLNNHGDYIDSVMDSPALSWTTPGNVISSTNFASAKLVQVGDVLLAFTASTLVRTHNTVLWTSGSAYGGGGTISDFASDGTTNVVVTDGSAVFKTANLGASWASAGTVGTGTWSLLAYFNGTWIIAKTDGLKTDADLAGTWTDQSAQLPASWSGTAPKRMVASPNELLIMPSSSSSRPLLRTTNGTTFAAAGTIPDLVTLADIAYSPARGEWAAVTQVGDVYVSANGGQTWAHAADASVPVGGGGIVCRAIAPLGGAWVIVFEDRLTTTRDFVKFRNVSQMTATVFTPGTVGWDRLYSFRPANLPNNSECLFLTAHLGAATDDLEIRRSGWVGG